MNQQELKQGLGNVDIYLLDQIMKNRYLDTDLILDAGCGTGRNLSFILNLGLNIEGCDMDEQSISMLESYYPDEKLTVAELDKLPYKTSHFNHIVCSAVLHFAKDETHFLNIINELHRVIKPKGTLFIRMTSIFGLESEVIKKDGQYLLPDGSYRFLLTTKLIDGLSLKFNFIEPLKTVNVNGLRCMSTLVLEKITTL